MRESLGRAISDKKGKDDSFRSGEDLFNISLA